MTIRRLVLPLLLMGLLLTGCDEETQQEVADALESAIEDDVGSEPTQEEAAPEPTEEEPAPEPTEEEPAPEPTEEEPAPEPTEESAESEPLDIPWVPIIIGAALLLLVGALIAAGRGRSDAQARRNRLRDAAMAECEWLLGTARERAAGVDAGARARDVRMRLDRLTDSLQELRRGAKDQVVAAASELQTTARQLADALIARLDDAVAGRDSGADLAVDELAARLRVALDSFGETLGRPR